MSHVTRIPAATPAAAEQHFKARLSVETDCADVEASMRDGPADFVVLHTVGSPGAFASRHIPGATHLPHGHITAERLSQWHSGLLFVVYCAGPHCNGADQAALKIAQLGRPVKIMIGGLAGWADEGFAFASRSMPAKSTPAA